jgi:hypothetical protein
MAYSTIEEVQQRKNFYRDGYHKILKLVMINTFIIIGLFAVLVILKLIQVEPDFYATSNEGDLWGIQAAQWGSRIVQPNQDVTQSQS